MTDFNAILSTTLVNYSKGMVSALLVDDIFSTPEQKAERKRLDRIGPAHGPWTYQPDWRTRHGRITTYYKGRVCGAGYYSHHRCESCD